MLSPATRPIPVLLVLVLAASLLSVLPIQAQPAAGEDPLTGVDDDAVGDPAAAVAGTADVMTPALPAYQVAGTDLVRIMAGAFDPLGDPPAGPAEIEAVDAATLAADVPVYWLVQTRDGNFAGAQAAIAEAGAMRAGFVPDAAYLVRATPRQRDALAASPAVRAAVVYQPAWTVPGAVGGRPGLLDLDGAQDYRVYAFTVDPDVAGVHAAVAAVDGVTVLETAGRVIDVTATDAQIPAIAAISGVEWIESVPEVVPMNANARWVNDTGVRDLYAATLPGRLDGAGQTAGVADTGVNYTIDDNGVAHEAFRDCGEATTDCLLADYTQANPGNSTAALQDVVSNGTEHRKMSAYFDIGNSGVSRPTIPPMAPTSPDQPPPMRVRPVSQMATTAWHLLPGWSTRTSGRRAGACRHHPTPMSCGGRPTAHGTPLACRMATNPMTTPTTGPMRTPEPTTTPTA